MRSVTTQISQSTNTTCSGRSLFIDTLYIKQILQLDNAPFYYVETLRLSQCIVRWLHSYLSNHDQITFLHSDPSLRCPHMHLDTKKGTLFFPVYGSSNTSTYAQSSDTACFICLKLYARSLLHACEQKGSRETALMRSLA